ncbi:hypothetical protein [Bacteriovorax sp. Seq25_V]|uniref:hypothetical protein n=1 Tax=Bacteriovorax sp. Seq25_V TaxID=1201288 RepID=UPI0012F8C004|nr:hypothetical protein [Bacteriovorax sp. Seq25_V]
MISIKNKKNRKVYLLNMKKIGLMHDFKWYERSGFFYPIVSLYYLVNFLSSWASVPFNILIVFANVYHSSISEIRGELDYLKEYLFVDKSLGELEVFIIHHLTEKNIIPSIVGEEEAVRILESLARDYKLTADEEQIQTTLRVILSRAVTS